jgi:4-amino-4-deoxy-L-arabinose transferase-like glycosyltransferase
MNDFKPSRISQSFKAALLPISIIYIVLFIYVAISRIDYPFELNWMEGGLLDVVERILDGKPIYTEPSLEYVPFIYTPLYYFLTAFIAKLMGPGFMALRLVSVISTLFCIILIYLFVKHDTRSGFLGAVSAGLFAAFYNAGGNWMDIGRNDSLNLLILLSALFIVRFYRNSRSYLIAGILLFLAFFTQQSSVILIIFILGYGIIYNRKSILPIMLSTIVLIVGSTIIMDKFYDSWYSYFVVELPLNREISISNIILFWTEGLFRTCMVPIGFIIYYLYSNFKSARRQPGWSFNLFAGAGMISTAWFLQVHSGNLANALLPAYAMITILFGISLNDILKKLKSKPDFNQIKLQDIVYLLVILQFITLVYDPRHLIPSRADRAAGEEFIESISKVDGDIFIPAHGYLAARAGKKQYAHAMAIYDVYRTNDDEASMKLKEEINEAFGNRDFAAVIYDDLYSPIGSFDSDSNYAVEKHMFVNGKDFFSVAGTRIRPQYFFSLKKPPMDEFPVFEMIGPMPLPTEE